MKKILIALSFIGMLCLSYTYSRPLIIIHTHIDKGYFGKISKPDGSIDNLYIHNYTVKYRLPHRVFWRVSDEYALFSKYMNDLYTKDNVDFQKIEIFIDDTGNYSTHSTSNWWFNF